MNSRVDVRRDSISEILNRLMNVKWALKLVGNEKKI